MAQTDAQKAYQKRRYAENREELKAKQRRYTRDNPEQVMLTQSRIRARKRGLEHTLTLADIQIPGKCPILGIELKIGVDKECSPSLDRIDSSRGYTPDNVWVISLRANRIKNDSTPDELLLLARALAAQTADRLHCVSSDPMEVVVTPGTY
jgi:hypothetical protein